MRLPLRRLKPGMGSALRHQHWQDNPPARSPASTSWRPLSKPIFLTCSSHNLVLAHLQTTIGRLRLAAYQARTSGTIALLDVNTTYDTDVTAGRVAGGLIVSIGNSMFDVQSHLLSGAFVDRKQIRCGRAAGGAASGCRSPRARFWAGSGGVR